MNKKLVEKLTTEILSIEHDSNKPYEFMFALANARSFLENKISIQTQQTMAKISMKTFMSMITNRGE